MCVSFDAKVSGQCREERAEPPADKSAANFCDYFKANPDAYLPPDDKGAAARSELEALFGDPEPADDGQRTDKKAGGNPLDDLFDL